MTFGRLALAAALVAAPSLAAADEPRGCEAFRWPLEKELSALAAATKPVVRKGGALRFDSASTLQLAPYADAGLPHAPERAPKAQPSFAGHFTLPAPAKPGVYKVTIAAAGWIDVIDNGSFLHPLSFSEARDCEGARKSVKFDLPARPVDMQCQGPQRRRDRDRSGVNPDGRRLAARVRGTRTPVRLSRLRFAQLPSR